MQWNPHNTLLISLDYTFKCWMWKVTGFLKNSTFINFVINIITCYFFFQEIASVSSNVSKKSVTIAIGAEQTAV
jgi:hypothetical protein